VCVSEVYLQQQCTKYVGYQQIIHHVSKCVCVCVCESAVYLHQQCTKYVGYQQQVPCAQVCVCVSSLPAATVYKICGLPTNYSPCVKVCVFMSLQFTCSNSVQNMWVTNNKYHVSCLTLDWTRYSAQCLVQLYRCK
jgi:hypothetical protein